MEGSTLQFAQIMFVVVMSTAGFVGVALGARILWRKGSPRTPGSGAYGDVDRMQRLEMAVDSIAIEVERISESQRFMVGLMSESLPARLAPARAERVNTPH
jgi:hypothetical protein